MGWVLVVGPRGTLSRKMGGHLCSRSTGAAGPPVPQALNLYFSTRLHVSRWVHSPAPTLPPRVSLTPSRKEAENACRHQGDPPTLLLPAPLEPVREGWGKGPQNLKPTCLEGRPRGLWLWGPGQKCEPWFMYKIITLYSVGGERTQSFTHCFLLQMIFAKGAKAEFKEHFCPSNASPIT